ncbi:tyrosine-type recombinase/integrase [Miltoncostaea marina]|uniref:tyrosine-type recombinase/integrase n=1 Tax=Miltoncostaea marina TaxID=2843215 RepID=UPI001C3C5A39|nr:site-specific integrase [Miltoncostaea marina]
MTIDARGGAFRARVRRRGVNLTRTFPSLAEAQAWRHSVIAALERGGAPPDVAPVFEEDATPLVTSEPITVLDACREWAVGALRGTVRTRSGRRYRESSVHTCEYRLRLHVLPYLGRLPVGALTAGTVRRWLEELEADTSPTTARLALDALRPAMRRLVEHEVIPVNPCAGVRPPAAGEEARPIRFLTPDEGRALRNAADADGHPRIGAFVDLGLATGARRGELLALRWADVDLEAREVMVRASFNLRTRETGPTKSGKGREVPIGAQVAARMRRYRLAVGRPGDDERVFPFDPREAFGRVRTVLPAPLPTIHSMRHSAATWWLASGLTVHAVAELLGHADPTLVLKRYGHALPAERSTAGERLEAFLEGAGGP